MTERNTEVWCKNCRCSEHFLNLLPHLYVVIFHATVGQYKCVYLKRHILSSSSTFNKLSIHISHFEVPRY